MKKCLVLVFLVFFVAVSCSKQSGKVEANIYMNLSQSRGVYIGCEGNFTGGNASLSYYDKNSKESYNKIFENTNNFPVGDVLQSTKVRGDKLFMMVNNSGKIYIVDKNSLLYSNTIKGLVSPRYIEFIDDNKAYITDLYSPAIAVLDLQTLKVNKSILVGYSPTGAPRGTEEMVRYKDIVYTSSWSYGDQVYKIDVNQDKVVDSLTVTLQPNSLVLDKNNKLWVLSDGGYVGNPLEKRKASLTCIDAETFKIDRVLTFNSDIAQPSRLRINSAKDALYFVYGSHRVSTSDYGVYKMSVDATQLPASAYIPADGKLIYSLGIDPQNEDIYIGDALDYVQRGVIYRYSKDAEQIDRFSVGIIPGSFTFKTN